MERGWQDFEDSLATGSKDYAPVSFYGPVIYTPDLRAGDNNQLIFTIGQKAPTEQEDSVETKQMQLRDHLAAHDPTFQAQQLHGSVENAYGWISQEQSFTRWISNDGPSTLWINGPPGIGKSTMLRGILKESSPSNPPEAGSDFNFRDFNLAYFFCDENDSSRRTTDAILRAFLFLLMDLDIPQSLEIKAMLMDLKPPPDPAFITALFWACLEPIRNSTKKVLLIVDAVDECTDSNTHLLDLISKTMAMSDFAHLRWLISSRESSEIKRRINPENHLYELKLRMNRDKLRPALAQYIGNRVRSLNLPHDDHRKVVLCLRKRAQGMFLWARLDCDRIEALPQRRILKEMNDRNLGLDNLYEKAVARARNHITKKVGYFATTAQTRSLDRMLDLAAIAYRNLSLNTVKAIWGWESGNDDLAYMEDLVNNSGLLVMKDEMITFVHLSAKQYLQMKHGVQAAMLHHYLALRLLEITKSKLRPDILKLVRKNVLVLGHGPADIKESADTEQWEQLQDTLEYACIEWMHHLERAYFLNNTLMDDPKTVEEVSGFLTEALCPWLEAVSLFEGYSAIMIRIRCFEDLLANLRLRPGGSLQQKEKREDLYRLVREARQFVCFNWASISDAPLQATSSAATFIPKKSHFWKRSHSLRNPPPPLRVRRLWGEADDWDACVLSIVTEPRYSPEEVSFTRKGDNIILTKRHVVVIEVKQVDQKGAQFPPHHRNYYIHKTAKSELTILKKDETGQMKKAYEYQDDHVESACISDNGKLVCSLRKDGSARVEKLDQRDGTKRLVEKFHSVDAVVTCALFAPRKNILVMGTEGRKVLVQKITRSRSKQHPPAIELVGHSGKISCLAMSLDGKRLASGSHDCTVRLWDMEMNEPICLAIYHGHFSKIQSISFSPDNRHLVSAGLKDIRIWEMKDWKALGCPPILDNSLESEPKKMFFSPNGNELAILSKYGDLKVFNAATGEQTLEERCLTDPSPAYSPNGRFLIFLMENKYVIRDTARNGGWYENIAESKPSTFIWSPKRNHLAILLNNGAVDVLNIENWKGVITLRSEEPKEAITDAIFSPCGGHLATQCEQKGCIVWMLNYEGDWVETHRLNYEEEEEEVASEVSYRLVQFSENIHHLVVVQTESRIEAMRIFRLYPQREQLIGSEFDDYLGMIECVAISSDDKFIAYADSTRVLHIDKISAQSATEQDGLGANPVPQDHIRMPPDRHTMASDDDTSMASDDDTSMACDDYSTMTSDNKIAMISDDHITSLRFIGSSSDHASVLKVGAAKLDLRKLRARYQTNGHLKDNSIHLDRIGLSENSYDHCIYCDSSPVVQIPPAIACRPRASIILKRGLKIAIQNAYGKASVYVIRGLPTNKLPKQTHRFEPHFPEDKDDYDDEMSSRSDEECEVDDDKSLKTFDEDDLNSFDDGDSECFDASESSDSEAWEPEPRKLKPSDSREPKLTSSHTLELSDLDLTM
ncbi:unnamed protein product [Clonostachys rhizophaga]|uniref:NACHT domain-containing protein n=1 Tax=Clonostachys rhizophaga TaxID=160324 RepID=A0A9N9VFK4_9HYPO|nr:unnamed protein product [Clonostachys rhizophaga]